jgi:TPR repeat protein
MHIYQPRPARRKVEFQLATPKLPPIANDSSGMLPQLGLQAKLANIKHLSAPEIYRLAKNIYHRRVSVQADLEEAILYFRVAAEMSFPPARNAYATCLQQTLNPETAVYGYFATISLGTPEGVLKEMIRNYELAAQAGHKRAMNNLGICYIQGQGVPVDVERGLAYLLQAKELGDKMGARNYDTFMTNRKIPGREMTFAYSGR